MGTQLAALGVWWLEEVREAWLVLLERAAPARAQRFVLDLSSEPAALYKASTPKERVEFALTSEGGLPPLPTIWPHTAPQRARTVIILPKQAVLLCPLRIPPASDHDVARIVELQLERALPLPREQLNVDWVSKRVDDQSRLVTVASARRAYIESLRAAVRSWNWQPITAGCRGESGEVMFNLLPPPPGRFSFDIGHRERYLIGCALVLCVLYVMITLGRWWYERSSLRDTLEQARVTAASLHERRAALLTGSRPIEALQTLMRTPAAGDALLAVSAAVPQGSWLYQADIRASQEGVTIAMEGYTPVASVLLQVLEQSQRFSEVELIEATGDAIEAGSERIAIKARLRAGVP